MAHHVEPMEVDCIDSEFDNKENAYRHSNVLPCTEKGYEELDVSELNMKLRYSITPVSSPMSKSYTAYVDNRNLDSDDSLNCSTNENANLTRSLNSTMTNDSVIKSLKTLPLQTISTEQITDNNISSVLRQLDSTITGDDNNVTVTITGVQDIDENLSLPSSSSSAIHTPEATTPTNITKNEEGSPIIRGLKSVFNMFRSSQSPVPPVENDISAKKGIDLDETYCPDDQKPHTLASTPISAHRSRDGSTSKRSSPLKDSITFNDDLEKELQWKDDTILFSEEKIPIHKLFPPHNIPASTLENHQKDQKPIEDNLNATVEYMDVSYNNSIVLDSTVTDTQNNNAVESDGEFVDCETTFTKNESLNVENQKDPLSATLEVLDVTKNIENDSKEVETQRNNIEKDASKLLDTTNEINVENIPTINETIESKPNEPVSSNDADKTIDVRSIIVDEVPKKIENDSNNQKEPATDAENLLDITTENVLQSSSDVNNSAESQEKIEICNENEETVCMNHLALTESVTSILKPEQAGSNVSILSKSNLSIDILSKEAELEADISLLEEKLKDLSNTFEVDIKEAELEKDKNITQPITNETTIVSKSGDYPNVKECQIEPASEITNIEPNVVISQNTKLNPDGLTDNKDIDSKLDNTEQDLRECILSENTDVNFINASTEGSIQNENLSQVLKEFNTNLIKTPKDGEHSECPAISNLPLEEPANIPLPDDDDDFDIDMGVNYETLETVQSVPPDVLDTVKTESKLDVTDTLCLDKVFENASTVENVNSKLELPSSENLDETKDIVNSLTEIIGESLNNTATECMLDQSQRDESMEGIESTNDIQVLPDLVNQTMSNTTIDIEPVHEVSDQIQSVASFETISAMPNSSETILNATEEHKSLIEHLDTSLIKSESEQINAAINLNEEHTNAVNSDNIDIVPETNLEESQNVNAQNELNKNNVLDVDVLHHDATKDASVVAAADEELVLSENNSPYVSVIAEPIDQPKPTDECFEKIDIPLTTTNEAPSSPPIRSRGYNFNFDEMDDPFATKTKIRESPPTKSAEDNYENKIEHKKIVTNRRKSQPPERKKPILNKKKFNNTFDAGSAKNSPSNKYKDQNTEADSKNASVDFEKNTTVTMESNDAFDKEVADILDSTQILNNVVQENMKVISEHNIMNPLVEDLMPPVDTTIEISADIKSSIESVTLVTSQSKTSSSEQSTYYSAAASSSDSSISRNVFNLPEIDDMNFNPFATKSKMRQSPPINLENENPFATKSKMKASPNSLAAVLPKNTSNLGDEDKMDTELMEKDTSYNTSHTTSSSISTDDANITTHRVNTEDEDTEEGPFLEAEDAIEKLLGMDNDDMMQFNEIPAQASEENADGGELFIDAQAFEFLLNQNKSNVVADSGKESLFLKFDPLFAKRISSDGVLAALKKGQSTPTKPTRPSLRNEASPIAGPSTLNATYDEETNITQESVEDLNVTVAKPMMVVTPAVNPAVTPRNKTTTPPRSNRRSITFTSPAMAVIDRLLSLSGTSSFVGHDTSNTQVSREHTEADLALTQLRELLAEKEISVYQLRSESKELKDRLSSMETQVKILETDGQERLKKINDLNDRLAEKTKVNKSMAAVVEEYERTIASLIAETEQDKKRHAEERMTLINERDEQTAHLASMEVSFSDLHSKYEKSKQVILSCKANEEICKKSIKEFEVNLTKMQTNYEMLKQHATSKLNHANQELQKMTKAHESEVLKLNAMIKRKDMHITSLEETLAQKTKANEELTAICDELINKVG